MTGFSDRLVVCYLSLGTTAFARRPRLLPQPLAAFGLWEKRALNVKAGVRRGFIAQGPLHRRVRSLRFNQ